MRNLSSMACKRWHKSYVNFVNAQAARLIIVQFWSEDVYPKDLLRLQGGRVTQASGLTLAEGQKIARVYKKNSTGRVTPPPGTA